MPTPSPRDRLLAVIRDAGGWVTEDELYYRVVKYFPPNTGLRDELNKLVQENKIKKIWALNNYDEKR